MFGYYSKPTHAPTKSAVCFYLFYEQKEVEYFDTKMFTSLEDGDILFFDELLNADTMVLNACLTVLENRELISGKKLPKIIILFFLFFV